MNRIVAAFAAAALAMPLAAAASPQSWTLTRAEWAGAGSASRVLSLPPLRAAIKALDSHTGARLAVVHNGGEDGVFWASQLEGWLVSLGVPHKRLVDRAGAVRAGRLRLELETPGTAGPP